ncbi:MAG: M1 family metallopeptidase [Caldilineaceae bacterium]|nr:M1 family metallopeptidase [Caldilineaceae bacterium]
MDNLTFSPIHVRRRWLRGLISSLLVAAVWGTSLLAILLFVGACASSDVTAQPDAFSRYRPALKPEFQSDLDLLGLAPRYEISATIDPDERKLVGSATVVVPNTSADPWTYLVFRLYPMLQHYGGNMVIQSALVNGKPGTFVYINDNTAIRVDLDRPLLHNQEVTVQLTWRLEAPRWTDQPAVYALFGNSQQMLSLPLFYPSLAVYQDGPTIGAGQWWLTNGTERGDAAFNVTSLFAVTLTMPAAWVPVTSGTLVESVPAENGLVQHVYVTGPSREFVIHSSPLFRSVAGEAYGTRVTSYYLPGNEAAGQAALKYAIQALRIYSDRFGEYPFTDMRVAPAPTSYRGMEYPQVMLLGVEVYGRFRDKLEMLAAHEMAHQWWYQIVHNDPVQEPWLDEALAEYAMRLYMEDTRGRGDAESFVFQRWQTPLEGLKNKQQDTLVNQPVESFLNGTQYETVVYGKGALFFDRVRDSVGARRFDRFLQNYLRKYRWKTIDSKQFLEELRDLPDPALLTLFEQWIRLPNVQANLPRPNVAETAVP